MLEIFVCEDDEKQRENIVEIIEGYISMHDYDLAFNAATSDPVELIERISKRKTDFTGIYFLDIELNAEINGIALAAKIRKSDPNAKIVFITTHIELMYLTFDYKVEALGFITKGNKLKMKEQIADCINIAVERYLNLRNNFEQHIVVKTGSSSIKLAVSDVQFIETSEVPHQLNIHLKNRQLSFYGNISEMEKLNQNFYRCHQSYVVNTKNIDRIEKRTREIYMNDGNKCYASVRYLKGLLAKIEQNENR
jgi:two-component system response regulator AgrA